jgi:hypothetical protein
MKSFSQVLQNKIKRFLKILDLLKLLIFMNTFANLVKTSLFEIVGLKIFGLLSQGQLFFENFLLLSEKQNGKLFKEKW